MSENPLAGVVIKSMRDGGLTRIDLVRRMGYTRINRGLRRLDACLAGEPPSVKFFERLASSLSIAPETLQSRLAEFRAYQEARFAEGKRSDHDRQKQEFRPHLWIETSTERPTPIMGVALFGVNVFRRLEIASGILRLPVDELTQAVGQLCHRHNANKGGSAGPFGDITGYLFRKTWLETWRFSITGVLVNRNASRPVIPRTGLQLKNGCSMTLRGINRSVHEKGA